MESMTSRERLLTAISNKKPDRLPCQVHAWMGYYLTNFLGGVDQFKAYSRFGMDAVIYQEPYYEYDPKSLSNWDDRRDVLGTDKEGNTHWVRTITTPKGRLTEKGSWGKFTGWTTEHIIKSEQDFEVWNKYVPIPVKVDWSPVLEAKKRIGENGIVRSAFFNFGQGSVWQSFCGCMYDNAEAILSTYDNPAWVHYVLDNMQKKILKVLERCDKIESDLIETGGGAGSSTVISPKLHEEFCLPYDKKYHEALHGRGAKVVYHLCGGLMPLLDLVVENGADGLETMTPPEMGGDCDMVKADQQVGDSLFFVGGFDQNAGFERGNPKVVTEMVHKLFASCPNGGYICSPSDHFFTGAMENIQAFVDAAKECVY